jgi:gamma-glutamyltranspeptidase/glutathione hydrolase
VPGESARPVPPPVPVRVAGNGMVCAIDHLAASAGATLLQAGGSAADAAVAASAVLAVTAQDRCGMGGDLWAVIHPGGTEAPVVLNASGHAGSGADPARLRARGCGRMPDGETAVVTVPGCVDGWLTLHRRFGRLALADVLEPARRYAEEGFPASPGLALATEAVAGLDAAGDYRVPGGVRTGTMIRRPGSARTLAAIAGGGRDAFYGGEFGDRLVELGAGEFTEADLARPQADWVSAVGSDAWGHRLWTAPPNSQGYLTLSAAWIAAGLELGEPDDPRWAHLLVEASRQAGYDRPEVLHQHADGPALVAPARLAPRRAQIDPGRASALPLPAAVGDTIAVCAVDGGRQGVSLLQSNAANWGSGLVVPEVGIFLHNRGRGFNLRPGHPAEYGPGRRPPHTLSPAVVTGPDGALRTVLGTMGGDSQPQVLLQLLARLLGAGQSPGDALHAGRFRLGPPAATVEAGADDGFSTWSAAGTISVQLEAHAAGGWANGLAERGHAVIVDGGFSDQFGHAHLIDVRGDVLWGASDPRSAAGAAVGW